MKRIIGLAIILNVLFCSPIIIAQPKVFAVEAGAKVDEVSVFGIVVDLLKIFLGSSEEKAQVPPKQTGEQKGGATRSPSDKPFEMQENTEVSKWAYEITERLDRGCNNRMNYLTQPLSNGSYETIASDTSCEGRYWCTYLVVDSYNLAGLGGLSLAHGAVTGMVGFWQNTQGYNFVPYSGNDIGNIKSYLKPGCAIFYYGDVGDGDGPDYQHVEMIRDMDINDNGDGYITTYASNSSNTGRTLSFESGVVYGSPYDIPGFGCF